MSRGVHSRRRLHAHDEPYIDNLTPEYMYIFPFIRNYQEIVARLACSQLILWQSLLHAANAINQSIHGRSTKQASNEPKRIYTAP